jgi:hypothetical protein
MSIKNLFIFSLAVHMKKKEFMTKKRSQKIVGTHCPESGKKHCPTASKLGVSLNDHAAMTPFRAGTPTITSIRRSIKRSPPSPAPDANSAKKTKRKAGTYG